MKSFSYRVEIDDIGGGEWSELLPLFADGNLNQTWRSRGIPQNGKGMSHLVLKGGEGVVAMAQVSIRKTPGIKAGVATVYWGPIWRRKGKPTDLTILDKMVQALRDEYVHKRRLLLRIWPVGFQNIKLADFDDKTKDVLEKQGFRHNPRVQAYRTLFLDLLPPLEELRKNLAQKWRNQLNVAEKSNLTIMEGNSDEMYLIFLKMLQEMISRKKFSSEVNYEEYREVQRELPEPLKMKIFICNYEERPLSAGVFSAIGETGLYLLGASSNGGMKMNASNLIHWQVINWLKEKGCHWYDLGGIDPVGNSGVYHFKNGITGKRGVDAMHLGQFFLAHDKISFLLNYYIDRINHARSRLRRVWTVFDHKTKE